MVRKTFNQKRCEGEAEQWMELVGHRAEESAVMQKKGSNGDYRLKMCTH